jgi:hypothetical protein
MNYIVKLIYKNRYKYRELMCEVRKINPKFYVRKIIAYIADYLSYC